MQIKPSVEYVPSLEESFFFFSLSYLCNISGSSARRCERRLGRKKPKSKNANPWFYRQAKLGLWLVDALACDFCLMLHRKRSTEGLVLPKHVCDLIRCRFCSASFRNLECIRYYTRNTYYKNISRGKAMMEIAIASRDRGLDGAIGSRSSLRSGLSKPQPLERQPRLPTPAAGSLRSESINLVLQDDWGSLATFKGNTVPLQQRVVTLEMQRLMAKMGNHCWVAIASWTWQQKKLIAVFCVPLPVAWIERNWCRCETLGCRVPFRGS